MLECFYASVRAKTIKFYNIYCLFHCDYIQLAFNHTLLQKLSSSSYHLTEKLNGKIECR